VPSFDGGDDFVGICGPDEWFRVGILLGDEAVDGRLKVENGVEYAALQPSFESLAKKPSTALSHEQDVGVKWKVKRGWRSSHARTLACLWAA